MSKLPSDHANPFEPPRAGIGDRGDDLEIVDEEAEAIRREHIYQETSIRAIGSLNYFGTFFLGIGTVFLIALATGLVPIDPQPGQTPETTRAIMGVVAAFLFVLAVLNGAIGYGLRHLQVWARWTVIVLISLALVSYALRFVQLIGIGPEALASGVGQMILPFLIQTYILSLVGSARGRMIFSPAYKEVIAQTPHIRAKTSPVVWVLLMIVLLILFLAVGAAIMNSMKR